ncbi:iron-containing alcohol dehydrogenase, partial [Romboutsia sp.]|uniref:iron-containing alcohol dehydrogenase n=1 Tax=Romboutsia sp. TaxID=1965302 RepID=UPI002D06835E
QQVGEMASLFKCKKVFCIYDKGIKEAGIVDGIIENIKNSSIEVIEFDEVVPDPPAYLVEKAANIAKQENVDGIVAIGGGSSIDAAKGVNILLGNEGSILDYAGVNQVPNPGKPLIVIPTTSGTGSEVTVASVITDTENSRKVVFVGNNVGANLAIIDPALTLGLPKSITAATGMDAFSHAVEALTTTIATPMTDAIAEQAISIIYNNLPKAVENGKDIEARSNMSLGSMMAGIAFSNGFVHLGHALAHAMGAKWHIPHGVVCAIALPYAIEFNAEYVPEKIKRIGLAMGLDIQENLSVEDMTKLVVDEIRAFNKKVNIPTLEEIGVEKEAFEAICEQTMNELTINFSHKPVTKEAVMQILEAACEEEI